MHKEPIEARIRPAGFGDKGRVMAILKETGFFRPRELKVAEEVFDDAIHRGPDSGYLSFVAVESHKTIGWICFGPTPCTDGVFDIYWLAVAPRLQKRGLGTLLVQYATAAIENKGGRMIIADTSASGRYLATRRFYENLGYRPEACIKDFYAPGDDKIIYTKRIGISCKDAIS